MSLTLYGPIASRALRPLWYAAETGVDLIHIAERPHSDAVRALNPLGQVPVLVDGDTVISDSVVILHWLSDKSGALTFPPGTPERAALDARLAFLVADLEAPLWAWYRRAIILKEDDLPERLEADARDAFARAAKGVVRLMQGREYLAGETFTIADIVAGHIGGWAARFGFAPDVPDFGDYISRLQARPALVALRKT